MARQPDIQYVHYYTDGSAARKLETQPVRRNPAPQARRRSPASARTAPKAVIHVDPVAFCALLVAAVMLVAMVAGLVSLADAATEAERVEQYAAQLRAENAQLRQEYESGYDLEEIEKQALAMGMIPVTDAEHVTIQVDVPQPEQETGFWENVRVFLTGLFA